MSNTHRCRFTDLMLVKTALLGAVFLCAMVSCSSSSTKHPPHNPPLGHAAGAAPLAVSDASSSFAALASKQVLAAAMVYPRATMVQEISPPVSLTASDGTGLELVSLDGRAVIDGPLAFTELHLQFRNPRDRVIEGRFAITLPPEATVSRLAMRLDSGWQEAEMVERQLARRAYEDFLHRRQDPALLEKEAGNEFRARIFPIPARGVKDIIISYSQPLAGDQATYQLPLRGLPEIAHLRVSALVAQAGAGKAMSYRTVTLEKQGFVPDKDFEVVAPPAIAGVAHGDLVAARLRPEISAKAQPMAGLVVLFDTSASRAPGFTGQVEGLGALVRELAATHGDSLQLAVATFDQSVVPVYSGPARDFGKAQLDAILARRPLGASNLHAALTWAGSHAGLRRVLVMSDGIATAGHDQADELRAAVKQLATNVDRLDMILAGGIRDQDLAGQLVRGTLEHDGVVLSADKPATILARRISQTTASGIEVRVAGAKWVWPHVLDGLQPGDEALVFAGMESKSPAKALSVTLSGGISQSLSVALTPVARPLLERAAVKARIAQLSHARNDLDAGATDKRAQLKSQIVDLSTRYRVLSDFTALLVLESDADYQRFGIDRRALADILTVGPRGVEVFHRSAPILMAQDPVQDAPASRSTDEELKNKLSMKKTDSSRDDGAGLEQEKELVARDDNDAYKDQAKSEEMTVAEDMDGAEGGVAGGVPGGVVGGAASGAVASGAVASAQPAAQAPPPPVARPAPSRRPEAVRRRVAPSDRAASLDEARPEADPEADSRTMMAEPAKPEGPSPYSGKLAEIMAQLAGGQTETALVQALGWRNEDPGDVMALIALGEALEAAGNTALAARAYGSLIDLFPSRADMRRFAGERLERLGTAGAALAVDTYAKAVAQRPDHLTAHRLLGYALLRRGDHKAAFAAIEAGLARSYPAGRFNGGERILREDLGLVAAAWLKRVPADRAVIEARLRAARATLATRPSLRFVLNWETDANDVDFHIYDGKGGHAFYSEKTLPSGGALYEDVTTGFGPECFTIEGVPAAYPYKLQIHYYSRGPMGYGMGKLEVIEHDGAGNLRFDQRPYVVMNDGAFVDLGTVERKSAQIAR